MKPRPAKIHVNWRFALLRRPSSYYLLASLFILALILLISKSAFHNPGIDDLDSAHHLMDGYFFHDLIVDHPHTHLAAYVFDYYKQYPALGFIFWPPLFPLVLGVFCLPAGPSVLAGRVCLACFGLLFSFAFYAILRRRFPIWLSFAATAAAIAMPGIAWSFNQVMLELPTLAMICLATLAYLRFTARLGQPGGIARGLLLAVAAAAVIYTKQPGWFIYLAFIFDFMVLHRRFFCTPEVFLSILATVVLCLPLALFTLKFGHANLAQSVGNNTQLIMREYKSMPRSSLAAWTYYPKVAVQLVNPLVILLALAAWVVALRCPHFRRENALWFGWFLFAYLTFTWYDNRSPRHATFWWPAWILLAAAGLDALVKLVPRRWALAAPLLLLLPIPFQIRSLWRTDFTDYRQVTQPIAALFHSDPPGNILVFGTDKQVLIALIREQDRARNVHVLRGERLLLSSHSLAEVCRKYRIGTVLIELPASQTMDNKHYLLNPASFTPVPHGSFLRRSSVVQLLVFRYHGPIDPHMADVSLSNDLL